MKNNKNHQIEKMFKFINWILVVLMSLWLPIKYYVKALQKAQTWRKLLDLRGLKIWIELGTRYLLIEMAEYLNFLLIIWEIIVKSYHNLLMILMKKCSMQS